MKWPDRICVRVRSTNHEYALAPGGERTACHTAHSMNECLVGRASERGGGRGGVANIWRSADHSCEKFIHKVTAIGVARGSPFPLKELRRRLGQKKKHLRERNTPFTVPHDTFFRNSYVKSNDVSVANAICDAQPKTFSSKKRGEIDFRDQKGEKTAGVWRAVVGSDGAAWWGNASAFASAQ